MPRPFYRPRPAVEGASALHLLSVANNVPGLTILLKAKPQLDILDRGGYTPLQRAILHKKQDSSKLLVSKKVQNLSSSRLGESKNKLEFEHFVI